MTSPTDDAGLVHFPVFSGGQLQALCGDWSGSTAWTLARNVVSCPECVRRMAAGPAGQPVEQAEANHRRGK